LRWTENEIYELQQRFLGSSAFKAPEARANGSQLKPPSAMISLSGPDRSDLENLAARKAQASTRVSAFGSDITNRI